MMSSRLRGFLVAMLVACVMTSHAHAVLVASFDETGSGGSSQILTSLEFSLEYETDDDYFEIAVPGELGLGDIGQSFVLQGSDFPDFIDLLTDGVDQSLAVWAGGGGTGRFESIWFQDNLNLNGPDLVGFDIVRVEMVLNNITFDSPGSDPSGTGNWTDYSYDLTFNFYQVPEPGTAVLLGTAGMMVLLRRRSLRSALRSSY